MNCWRCGTTGTAIKLIMKLERIGLQQALAKIASQTSHRKDITQKWSTLVSERRISYMSIELPKESQNTLLDAHRSFLEERRFDPDRIFSKYDLRCVQHSVKWKHRLIIPIKRHSKLVSWTSRDVTGESHLKYKTASNEESIVPAKETLYNLDSVKDTVIITEGPLDVWRIGDGAVCTYGTQYTKTQLLLLSKMRRAFVLFDSDAENPAKNLGADLGLFVNQTEILFLEQGDPADMSEDDVHHLRREIFGKIF